MEQAQLQAFNKIINSGGYEAVKIAVAGMRAAYENSEGYEGKMLVLVKDRLLVQIHSVVKLKL